MILVKCLRGTEVEEGAETKGKEGTSAGEGERVEESVGGGETVEEEGEEVEEGG